MPQRLPQIVRELRRETCPPEVQERLRQRIAGRAGPRRPLQIRVTWTLVAILLLASWGTWEHQMRRAAEARAQRVRVRDQTEAALALVGHALRLAATRTEDTLSKQAGPPLRNGFENAKTKILNGI